MYQSVNHGDTVPARWRLTDPDTKEPIDLTDATVTVNVRVRKPVGTKIPIDGTVLTPPTAGYFAHPTDELDPAVYDVEIKLLKDGQLRTIPDLGFATLVVDPVMP